MKYALFFIIFLFSAHPADAKSPYRVSFDRFAHTPVVLSRYGLQLSKPELSSNPCRLASIALRRCPGTVGQCLKAVRTAVQLSKGLPVPKAGDTLQAKNWGHFLENKYGATRLSISNPHDAPVGSIIIYNPSKRSRYSAGHIEIVTEKGFCSDHLSKRPYAGAVLAIYRL